ncbi:restriction endonuclease subunit S [Runella zeae]|uniref:restriction endonuclease subunit S n=1 Tax=Runella zeae TaxID=94255 RepID=UPI0023545D5C|nr:restriction endonuclease subunit S [Runella zeae]
MSNKLTKISAVIEEISMGPFGSDIKVENFVSQGVPVLNGSNLTSFKLVEDTFKYVTPEKAKTFKKAIARRGDIVITHRGTLGQISYIPKDSLFDEYVISQSQFRVSLNKNLVDPSFFVYYFHTSEGQKRLLANKCHVGVPALAQATTNFRLIEIPLPSLTTQQKIASVLSALDAKIELNNRINAELEAMAKTLYDYWFVQFDFPNEEGKPYKSSGGTMVWNEELKREIPEGWEVEPLNNNIDLILDHRGKTPKKLGGDWIYEGDGITAISAKIVKGGKLVNLEQANKVSFEMYEKWMPEKLKEGDILMTSEAPLGEFYFLLGKTDYCMSQRLFAIRANRSKVVPSYLYYELSKGNGYSQIIGSQSGSTVFGIRQDELRKIKILKPDIKLQNKFEDSVIPFLQRIRNNDSQNQQLAELRDWLLPMLMNGQVKVQ